MSITSQAKPCPKCGGPIPAEAPQGLCPKCLLQQACVPTETGKSEPAKSAPPTSEELSVAFPQLEILGLIGQGGMGFVFKARQPKLERFVALKILPASLAADPAFAERFTREGRMLARLNHPNIVAIHDFGQANGFFYLLMEFVDGVNLRQAMKVGRFTPAQALSVVPKICEALQFAHNEGILHRDIKPENILLDTKGRVKIADFGIAKLLGEPHSDASLTASGATLGTPHYMAPEQLEHPQDVDQRADIYSLGVVLYEMLTGELPIGRFAPPSEKSSVDPRMDEVVLHTLEKERERRTKSADEVKTQVETIAGSTGTKVLEPGSPAAPRSPGSRQQPSGGMGRHLRRGATVGLLVFVLTLATATVITFLLPKTYRATARIKLEQVAPAGAATSPSYDPYMVQREMEVIKSDGAILLKVIGDLKLDERWGERFARGKLDSAEAASLLISGMEIRPVRNTQILDIGFHSDSPREAAEIANAIAERYRAYNQERLADSVQEHQKSVVEIFSPVQTLLRVDIIEQAVPPLHPSRPNRPLNIFLGGVIGFCLGLFAAGITTLVCALKSRWAPPGSEQAQPLASSSTGGRLAPAPAQPKPDRLWRWFAVVVLALISIPVFISILGILAAIAIPNFVKARQRALANHQQQVALLSATNPVSASGETWAPAAAPQSTIDLQKVLNEAKELVSIGAYEEALQRHIWYHNHSKSDPSQTGVRISFALSDWVELGRRYPKARQALVEIRDSDAREFSEGRGYFDLFMELAAINQYLGEDDATVALFKSIGERDKQLAQQCYGLVEPLLTQRCEYALCMSYIGKPDARFQAYRQSWEHMKQMGDRQNTQRQQQVERFKAMAKTNSAFSNWQLPLPPDLAKMANTNFVAQTCRLIEILSATGHKPDAESIRDQAVAILDDPGLKSAVDDAEKKVRK
ncbi:MAG TPA: protein kinase [Candidatus Binatia bacterium]|jgi:serine/threonine protein kinase|nr:protein kinase [Candidatus Binatia bacterium]